MTEHYERRISRHIRRTYQRRLAYPILYLCFLIFLWLNLSLCDIFSPQRLDSPQEPGTYTTADSSYIEVKLKDLYFTGYTNTLLGRTAGYYYYTLWEDQCVIVLLSPNTCEQGLPFLDSVHIRGRILEENPAFQTLLDNLSQDLHWTKNGISEKIGSYYISEPAFRLIPSILFFAVYFFTGAFALLRLLADLLYLGFPVLSPACRKLRCFGKPTALFRQAETELATLPKITTEDMFITEHFFIVLSQYNTAIVPIKEIIWIYKYSTLHKILWYHFSISYTLHITAKKRLYLQCPKNMKSDIDGIIDYLSEANHDILVGFSEENRLKIREMQKYWNRLKK